MNDLIKKLAIALQPAAGDNAMHEAWWMLEKITGKNKAQLLAQKNLELSGQQQKTLQEWVHQRVREHKPLQYILGSVSFVGLEILVRPPILIPRPETEEMVLWTIQQLANHKNQPLKILDLCTGSGCIALALAHAFAQSQVVGIDINPAAIALAQENQKHNQISNVTFIQSDLFKALKSTDTFDVIISNPPYISAQEYEMLDKDVKQWEDRQALVAQQEGMAFYLAILEQAAVHLKQPTSLLVMELGTESLPIGTYAQKVGFKSINTYPDMSGKQRWIVVSKDLI